MTEEHKYAVLDTLTLRFTGTNEDGSPLHELRASHVASVLEGIAEFTSDFAKAGAFHDPDFVDTSEVMVRPAEEGSFLIEVMRVASENPDLVKMVAAASGIPTLSSIIKCATKSARADVSRVEPIGDDRVLLYWQDDTVTEVPDSVWQELNKRKRRRKKQLRKLMAPLEDDRVIELDVSGPDPDDQKASEGANDFVLEKADYEAVYPSDEVEKSYDIFDAEAQMAAIDFDNPTQWRVKARGQSRKATVEDDDFLRRVAQGLAISRDDIFWLKIREDRIKKNERTQTSWTVLTVSHHRRNRGDNDT